MAATYKLEIDQGSDINLPLTLYEDDGETEAVLTGYTARLQARENIDSTVKLLDLTTENDGITISGGTITIVIPAATTSAMTVYNGQFDLELIDPDGKVERLLQGPFVVSREVTR